MVVWFCKSNHIQQYRMISNAEQTAERQLAWGAMGQKCLHKYKISISDVQHINGCHSKSSRSNSYLTKNKAGGLAKRHQYWLLTPAKLCSKLRHFLPSCDLICGIGCGVNIVPGFRVRQFFCLWNSAPLSEIRGRSQLWSVLYTARFKSNCVPFRVLHSSHQGTQSCLLVATLDLRSW